MAVAALLSQQASRWLSAVGGVGPWNAAGQTSPLSGYAESWDSAGEVGWV